MKKIPNRKIGSTIFYTILAVCFILSAFYSISVWAIGWIINPLDFFGWPGTNNVLFVLIEPFIFLIACTLAFYTFIILLAKSTSDSRRTFMGSMALASAFGLYGLLMNAIRIQTAAYEKIVGDSNSTPLIGAWLSFLFFLILFGLYLAWHDPAPASVEELQEWIDYSARTRVPLEKWMLIYWLFYFTFFTVGLAFLYVINDSFLEIPLLAFYTENDEIRDFLVISMMFFPMPFLHTLSFIIYYWKPIRIKLDLFLLKQRKGKEITDSISVDQNQQRILKEKKELTPKTHKQRLRQIILIECGFSMILFLLLLTLWVEALISSLWAFIYLLLIVYPAPPIDKAKLLEKATKRGQQPPSQ